MRKESSVDVQNIRFRRAAGIVGMTVVCCLVLFSLFTFVDGAGKGSGLAINSAEGGVEEIWNDSASKSVQQSLIDGGYIDLKNDPEVPSSIRAELIDPANMQFSQCYSNQDYSLVEVVIDDFQDVDAQNMCSYLENRGWDMCATGKPGTYSAVKDQGSLRWFLMSATVVGDSTSYLFTLNSGAGD